MTVKNIEAIFASVENKEMEVFMSGGYDTEINGFYIDRHDNKDALFLTRLNVQPRISEQASDGK